MSFKVAASDFDGTLYRDEEFLAEDLSAISDWRAAGNKFGIVTGRCRTMIVPLLTKHGVETDFLICDNGAIIFDGAGRILFETELPKAILFELMAEPFVQRSLHFAFETADAVSCANVKPESWVMRENQRWKFPIDIIEPAQIERLGKINQFALLFETPDEALAATNTLNDKFGERIHAQKNTYSVDIVAAGIDKAQGVGNLLRIMNWSAAAVHVIGDESNDLPMIRRFGGCTVSTAKAFVKREATTIFNSVGNMMKYFQKNP